MFSKLDIAGHCLWGKQHHDVIHSSRNFETACYSAWYYTRKFQYEHVLVTICKEILFHIDQNRIPSQRHGVLLGDKQWGRYAFIFLPTWLHTQHEVYIKCLEEVVLSEFWGWLLEDSMSGMPHILRMQKDCVNSQIISPTTCFLTSDRLTPEWQCVIIMCEARLNERQNSVQHQIWTGGEDNGCIYEFKHEIPMMSGGCDWSQWEFL